VACSGSMSAIRDVSAIRRADIGCRAQGLIAGALLMAGAFIAKRFVLRLEPDVFRLVNGWDRDRRRADHAVECNAVKLTALFGRRQHTGMF
jgi:hypothetical protein